MRLRRSLNAIVLVFAGLTLAHSAQADPTAEAKKAIQSAYNAENAAAARKDVKGIYAYYAPDYVDVSETGKTSTLNEEKSKAQGGLALAKSIKGKATIVKIKLKGKQAIVSVKEHIEFVIDNPQTKKTSTMAIDTISEETWAKSGKGWLKKRSRTISEKASADGKPLPSE